jgi:pyruvate formate-lyase/glycerol dehydratase family glycyl radical enzyme
MREYVEKINSLERFHRIERLKTEMQNETRYVSMEQARIVTEIYKETEGEPTNIRRAKSLAEALRKIPIRIDSGELIVGNRTPGIQGGVVFPEGGISWVDKELETLSSRPQDRFEVLPEDIPYFRNVLMPYWTGKTLEDVVNAEIGVEAASLGRVVKINQKDHAQGHICPDTPQWLEIGPQGLLRKTREAAAANGDPNRFLEGVILTLEGAIDFMLRYSALASEMAESNPAGARELMEVSRICLAITERPPESFHEALQSLWFLFTILHLESNASSFSPGRMDQFLYPYFKFDMEAGNLELNSALELVEALWVKFNQIVYLRNSNGARYFAGFPIGFNVALGGQDSSGNDASNELSFLFLKAQEHLGLPQPNLSARIYEGSPDDLVDSCSRVIGYGSGMPQIFNDEAIIPALQKVGFTKSDAMNYAIIGCVELSTQGKSLGWSDAAMFNLVKALELTLTGGIDLIDGKPSGLNLGTLPDYKTFEDMEKAYSKQIDYFIDRMIPICHIVDRIHGEIVPSPFLSSVIDSCIEKGIDVTDGGAHYNLSGIQAIQPANIADSLAALKTLVYDKKKVTPENLLKALQSDFEGEEILRQRLLNKAEKYGNDVEWVDELGHKWVRHFANRLEEFTNRRGGPYHTGLYTVSAHVPMGQNVGATPDGRHSEEPLADGGMSAVYGRDTAGPTALLRSVSRVDSSIGSNGTLLNMKFSPQLFRSEEGIQKFSALLRTFVSLKISHVQFNVLTEDDLRAAIENPEDFRNLTVRVAGYTAYFTELAGDLQEEIIARTTYLETL